MSRSPRRAQAPAPMAPKMSCPSMRSHSMTGSVSGSASPSTRYGSFPPSTSTATTAEQYQNYTSGDSTPAALHAHPRLDHEIEHIEDMLRASLRRDWRAQQDSDTDSAPRKQKKTLKRGRSTEHRSWSKSTERMFARDTLFDSEDETETPGRPYSHDDLLDAEDGHSIKVERKRSRSRNDGEEMHWGVRKMVMMGTSWSRKTLVTLYAGVYLISALTSLEMNTTPTVEPYYVSYLGSHSSLSTLVIVGSVAYAVGKPPFAKILDVFGRAEGIALAGGVFAAGYFLAACANSIPTFLVAKALAALGAQGIQLAQQIIVADTTTLTNRGLITSTISLPWLVTTWIGPTLGAALQSVGPTGYRATYALFALLVPFVSCLLVVTLFAQWRRTKRLGNHLLRPDMVEVSTIKASALPIVPWTGKARAVWAELDVIGLVALTVGCVFLLVPFTIAQQRPAAFSDFFVWSMILFGLATLVFFWKYESDIAKQPLLPPRLLGNRTILCGSALGFFHFASQFCYESFFTSFLQVARGHSPRDASYISQSYIFSASISAILAGLGAKWSQRYKWIGIVGVLTHLAGTCLMLRTRNLDSSTFELVLSQVIGGVGGGFATLAAQIGCQSVVTHQDVGIATAIFLTLTQVGGAVGGAVAGGIWSSILPKRLRLRLPASSDADTLVPQIMSSLPFAMSFDKGTAIRDAIDAAYVDVQRVLNATAIALLVPGLVAVCWMRNVHLEREDQGPGSTGAVVLGTASKLHDDESTNSETSSLLREPVDSSSSV